MGSSPNWSYGYVPTAAQWNAQFSSKQDDLGYTPVNRAGDTMLGRLVTFASSQDRAGLNVSPGIGPNSPVNGDIWFTSTGIFARVGDSTVGPIGPGTITSVGLSAPSEFSVEDSPVTTTGTLALTWNDQTQKTFLAGPTSGISAAPTFRALLASDLPSGAAQENLGFLPLNPANDLSDVANPSVAASNIGAVGVSSVNTFTAAQAWAEGAAIASAATLALGSDGNFFHVTGTTTITAVTGTPSPVTLVFDGSLTLTHNATSLILPGGKNIVTAAGDVAVLTFEGAGNWRCTSYQSANLISSSLNSGQFGNRRKNLNGNFSINQRVKSGTVTLTAGQYGHDMWKGGASGATYTFATSGGVTTVTISAGSLVQKIEGLNLQTATYVLSWSGTAQGKIGAGSFSASGVTSSITGGADTNIEFGIGTLSLVQLEGGNIATSFEYLPFSIELSRCQRFYWNTYEYGTAVATSTAAGALSTKRSVASETTTALNQQFTVAMQAAPTVTFYSPNTGTVDRVFDASAATNVVVTGVSAAVPTSAKAPGFPTHAASGAAGAIITAHVVAEVTW